MYFSDTFFPFSFVIPPDASHDFSTESITVAFEKVGRGGAFVVTRSGGGSKVARRTLFVI